MPALEAGVTNCRTFVRHFFFGYNELASGKCKNVKVDPILVYGVPGSGKTTLIRRLAEAWGFDRCAGFFTQEVRKGGARVGFQWETFQGEQGLLADMQAGSPRVGKYKVHLQSFEEMLSEIEIKPGQILLIDEVGKMECLSPKFRSLLSRWVVETNFRIFTVPFRGTSFIEAFKTQYKAQLIELNPSNRDQLLADLLSLTENKKDEKA